MPGLKVIIDQGELLGFTSKTQEGFKFNGYCGIPYAKPPVGELRFRDPLPAEKWTGVLDATKEGSPNAQFDLLVYNRFVGEEDSLFLNVYVPENIANGTKLPVMFWIHGGAFQNGFGSKIMYGPDYLIQHNVIVVTINYRLGVLGFLSLNTPEVPGNAGLKDQVMALKWVQNNIEKFGGDKDNVTIFGESAGSCSVHLLMLSPMASGLFHKAILQSGSALNRWCVQHRPEESAFALAEKLGLKSNDKKEILHYLRKVKPEDLAEALKEGFQLSGKHCFCPVVEAKFSKVESIINESPIDIIKSGKYNTVPYIIGFTSKEGVLFLMKDLMGDAEWDRSTKFEELKLDIANYLPEKIALADPQIKSAVVEKIKNFYFPPDQPAIEGLINFMSDTGFFLDIARSAHLMSSVCDKSYYYQFSFHGNLNLLKNMVDYDYTGAAHADDLGYLFMPDYKQLQKYLARDKPKKEIKKSQADIITIKRMTSMWTNFAKNCVPILETSDLLPCIWEPIQDGRLNCLNIGENVEMEVNPLAQRLQFWTELMKQ